MIDRSQKWKLEDAEALPKTKEPSVIYWLISPLVEQEFDDKKPEQDNKSAGNVQRLIIRYTADQVDHREGNAKIKTTLKATDGSVDRQKPRRININEPGGHLEQA